MKFSPKNIVVGMTLSLMLVIAFVPHIFAEDGTSGGTTTTTTEPPKPTTTTTNSGTTNNTTEKSQTDPENGTSTETAPPDRMKHKLDNPNGEVRKEIAREKLDDKKKAICEEHKSALNTVVDNVVQRSKNHFDRITAIYDMTTKFYTDKGLSVSNYTTLVANVESAKAAAVLASQNLDSTPQFSCESDGPKADIQAFRNKRLDKVDTFASYRDAVKTLVTAVKAAAQVAEGTTK